MYRCQNIRSDSSGDGGFLIISLSKDFLLLLNAVVVAEATANIEIKAPSVVEP